ncbi:hypothetical protein Tco_1565658 [Tanacetum coccineum]
MMQLTRPENMIVSLYFSNQTWSDNKAKLAFVENLLRESEKLMWQQWRTAYPEAYFALEAIADEPQNITSQVNKHSHLDITSDHRSESASNTSITPDYVHVSAYALASWQEEEKDFNSNEVKLLKELLKEKTEQVQQMIRDQAKEYYENKAAIQKKEEIWQSKESLLIRDLIDALKIIEELRIEKKRLEEQKDEEIRELKAQLQKKEEEAEVQFSREEFPLLGNTHVARPCVETEVHYSENATASPKFRKITNQLYNVKVEFDIPNCTVFGTTVIIDTGASTCCINKKVIPEEALEPLTQTVVFNGLNSSQQATHRID